MNRIHIFIIGLALNSTIILPMENPARKSSGLRVEAKQATPSAKPKAEVKPLAKPKQDWSKATAAKSNAPRPSAPAAATKAKAAKAEEQAASKKKRGMSQNILDIQIADEEKDPRYAEKVQTLLQTLNLAVTWPQFKEQMASEVKSVAAGDGAIIKNLNMLLSVGQKVYDAIQKSSQKAPRGKMTPADAQKVYEGANTQIEVARGVPQFRVATDTPEGKLINGYIVTIQEWAKSNYQK